MDSRKVSVALFAVLAVPVVFAQSNLNDTNMENPTEDFERMLNATTGAFDNETSTFDFDNQTTGSENETTTTVTTRPPDSRSEDSTLGTAAIVGISVGGGVFALFMLIFTVPLVAAACGGKHKGAQTAAGLLGNEVQTPESPYKANGTLPNSDNLDIDDSQLHNKLEPDTPPESQAQTQKDQNVHEPRQSQPQRQQQRHMENLDHDQVAMDEIFAHPDLSPDPGVTVVQPQGMEMSTRRISSVYLSMVSSNPSAGGMTWDWPSFDQPTGGGTNFHGLSTSSISAAL